MAFYSYQLAVCLFYGIWLFIFLLFVGFWDCCFVFVCHLVFCLFEFFGSHCL